MTATRAYEYSAFEAVLYLAFELSSTQWKLGFTNGRGRGPRRRTIEAGDLEALQEEIRKAKKKLDLPGGCRVLSWYEAGGDGFWLHRYLEEQGIENLVVDSSSIQANRRVRQAKTDRMDVEKLLSQLIRHRSGERDVWSVVRVPSVEGEDKRQLHRELRMLKKDRTRHVNRIKSFLVAQGIRLRVNKSFLEEIDGVRKWDGSPLPEGLKARLRRNYQRLQLVQEQIKVLERQRVEAVRHSEDEGVATVRDVLRLRGIGLNASWSFGMELFSWRRSPGPWTLDCVQPALAVWPGCGLRPACPACTACPGGLARVQAASSAGNNRKEVGALSGLVPMPHQSGESYQEKGISKAGNRHIRAMAVEIAWGWLRYQPESELTKWYEKEFGHGSKRIRKIGTVALARKLMIALWRYLETGVIPEGSVLKTRLI